MNYWMCSECQYIFPAKTPPKECPGCQAQCTFSNVTCYIPECGGPGNIDARLVAARIKEAKKQENPFSPEKL